LYSTILMMINMLTIFGLCAFSVLGQTISSHRGRTAPSAGGGTSGLSITDLKCEYLSDPLGIDVRNPRLSWVLHSSQRGQKQTAYQVLAASTPERLAKDEGDLWDSGKLESDQTTHVVYRGKLLQSQMVVDWKVRVWDKDQRPSAWSKPALWTMGLLEPSDWRAKWIAPADTNPSASPMFRKEFSLRRTVDRATLTVTALGLYEVRINGQRVGDHILAPEWTDYHKRVQYQTYDVTNLLLTGGNAVGVVLGEGWYAGRIGGSNVVPNGPLRRIYGGRPRFILQLRISLADGNEQSITTDETWRCFTDGPIRSSDILDGEVYDARLEKQGWDSPGFDDTDWGTAVLQEPVKAQLVAQPNEPIRIVKLIKPIALTEPKSGVFVFDLGQNMVGWCRLHLKGKAGTTVTLRHAEVLNPDGTIYRDNLRMPDDGGPLGARQQDQYTLRGNGWETFEPHFTYHGFRYVEVTGLSEKPRLDVLLGCAFHSSAPDVGHFECSNPLLNKLMQNILWTQWDNMIGVPTDCPQRDERLGWMGDMQVFSQTACYNMDMSAFFTKWVRDIRDAQADDGRFPDFAPHPYGPNERFSGNPGWGDAGVIVPWRVYVNYADKRLLEEHFEAAKRWIDFIRLNNPDLIWMNRRGTSGEYGDWLNGNTLILDGYPKTGGEVPKEIHATAFFAYSTELVSKMASVLGRLDDAKGYAALARDIRKAFNRAFVSPDGTIKGNTQAGYALALSFDLLPDSLRQAAAAHMVKAIEAYNGRLSTGFETSVRMMMELSGTGYNDIAYSLINSRTIPSWGYMIEHGATTIWERWDGYVEGRGFQDKGMNSFNHYAIGAVGEWMWRTIVGINPDEENPSYKHIVIRPRAGGGLTMAKGTYSSIRGPITSEWSIKNGVLALKVIVPPNTTATVYVPAKDAKAVKEGNLPADRAEGVRFVRAESGSAVFEVESGVYTFTAPFSTDRTR
jgi:alpha-L-rhamnosidase